MSELHPSAAANRDSLDIGRDLARLCIEIGFVTEFLAALAANGSPARRVALTLGVAQPMPGKH